MELPHLVRRFVFSLRPAPPDPADEAWLRSLLSPTEAALYDRQPRVDRIHSVRCAVAIRAALGSGVDPTVVVASALHDVGKAEPRLGTSSRVLATLLERTVGTARLASMRHRTGYWGRLGKYAFHPERGAELLERAGAAELTVAWARGHHLDHPDGVPTDLLDVLRRADHA